MNTVSETRLRARYAETDRMGVVYYANYLVWMEVGRVELCKSLGFDYRAPSGTSACDTGGASFELFSDCA